MLASGSSGRRPGELEAMLTKSLIRSLAAGLLAVGIAGCDLHKTSRLGKAPSDGQIVTVSSLKPAATMVTLHGTMVEKCPVAGCWFMLRDKTGVVKVDTKRSGF